MTFTVFTSQLQGGEAGFIFCHFWLRSASNKWSVPGWWYFNLYLWWCPAPCFPSCIRWCSWGLLYICEAWCWRRRWHAEESYIGGIIAVCTIWPIECGSVLVLLFTNLYVRLRYGHISLSFGSFPPMLRLFAYMKLRQSGATWCRCRTFVE